MSHECPDCGQICYCDGDIDDCCNNLPRDVDHCKHCQGEEGDDEYEPYEDDPMELKGGEDGEQQGIDTNRNTHSFTGALINKGC